jgi:ATP-dependent RNA helicase RhlE
MDNENTPASPASQTEPENVAGATERPTWESLRLSDETLDLIRKAGYTAPTPIQEKAIPLALDGYDLIASAQTGTGKTASFVIPMVEALYGKSGTYGLILAPTREIAQQIQATLDIFAKPQGLTSVVLIGGIDLEIDKQALKTYPTIIVATPGRLCDHLDRGTIWLDYIEMVVLDEADRMLDMGFADQLARIMQDVPKSRQTLLFSATMPPSVDRLAQKILYQPERVAIGKPLAAASTVEQRVLWMKEESKTRELYRLMREEKGSMIVFVRSKIGADKLWRALHSAGYYDVTCIHSDRIQSAREQSLADFKAGKYRVLIATDVVGRGIHVDGIAHVVNYDLPMEPEDYVHRIGRTGRQDATGRATSFVTPRDRGLLGDIERVLKARIPEHFADSVNREEGASEDRSGTRHSAGGAESRSAGGHKSSHHKSGGSGDGNTPSSKRRRRRGGRGRRGGSGGGNPNSPGGSPQS